MSLRTVLVGTDGSADATAAVVYAARVARDTDSRLVIVHAPGLLDAQRSPGEHPELRTELDWIDAVRDTGITVETVLRDGHPVQVLLDVADKVDADLVAVGRRGEGGFPQQLLGSTSMQLAQHSHRPVLVVPRSAP